MDFFLNLIKKLSCFKSTNLEKSMDDNESNKDNKLSGFIRRKKCRNSFLNRLLNKTNRFENYRPTKRYKKNKSTSEMIYSEQNKNDDSVYVFQLNKKSNKNQLLEDK